MSWKERLVDNPCRGIVVGLDQEGNGVQLCWIMGRSERSQDRNYRREGDNLVAVPHSKKREHDDLRYYTAIANVGNDHIISNGDHLDDVIEYFREGVSMPRYEEALGRRYVEPDDSFTPRIIAWSKVGNEHPVLSILKAEPVAKWNCRQHPLSKRMYDKEEFPTLREHYVVNLERSLGYCITTYNPGSKELPSYEGPPFKVPIVGNLKTAMRMFWNALEPEWRVALAGKLIRPDGTFDIKTISRWDE